MEGWGGGRGRKIVKVKVRNRVGVQVCKSLPLLSVLLAMLLAMLVQSCRCSPSLPCGDRAGGGVLAGEVWKGRGRERKGDSEGP